MKHYKFLSFLLIIPTLLTSCGQKEITKPVYEGKINHIYKEIVEKISHIHNGLYYNHNYTFEYDETTVYNDPNDIHIFESFGHYNDAYLFSMYFDKLPGWGWFILRSFGILSDSQSTLHKKTLIDYASYAVDVLVYKNGQLYDIQYALDNDILGLDFSMLNLITYQNYNSGIALTRENKEYYHEYKRYSTYEKSGERKDEFDDSEISNLYVDYVNTNNLMNKKIKHGKAQIGSSYVSNIDLSHPIDDNYATIYSFDIPSEGIYYGEDYLYTKEIGGVEIKVHANAEPVVYLPNQEKIISLEDALNQQIINQDHLKAMNKVDEFIQDGTIGMWPDVNLMEHSNLI